MPLQLLVIIKQLNDVALYSYVHYLVATQLLNTIVANVRLPYSWYPIVITMLTLVSFCLRGRDLAIAS